MSEKKEGRGGEPDGAGPPSPPSSPTATARYATVLALVVGALLLLLCSSAMNWSAFDFKVKGEEEIVRLDSLVVNKVEDGPINADAVLEAEERERKAQIIEELEAKEDGGERGEGARDATPAGPGEKKKKKKKKVGGKKKKKGPQKGSPATNESKGKKGKGGGKYDSARLQERKNALEARYQEALARHEWKMVPRDFDLPPTKQAIVDDFAGSLKPPAYCYSSPGGREVHPREPDSDDARNADLPQPVAKKILRLLGADYPCLIMNQECLAEEETFEAYDTMFFNHSRLSRGEKIAKVPSFRELRLGTCAIVGNADNVLAGKYGEEIDEHDFVVRFNVETGHFKEAVGSKTGGMFIKVKYRMSEHHRDFAPTMFNLFPKYAHFRQLPLSLPPSLSPLSPSLSPPLSLSLLLSPPSLPLSPIRSKR